MLPPLLGVNPSFLGKNGVLAKRSPDIMQGHLNRVLYIQCRVQNS